MAIAFRSSNFVNYASRATSTTINAPAGVANDDILICGFVAGFGGLYSDITAPAGWTQVGTTSQVNDGSFYGQMYVFWKRAASEGSSYVFTHAFGRTLSTNGVILAYTGGITSGSPVDVFSKNTGTGATSTATSVTTTAANDRLVWLSHDWQGSGTLSPPTGFTERYDNLLYAADALQASAGASGNKTQTTANSAPDVWAAWLVAIKEAAGGGGAYTLSAVAGSHALTGATASLEYGREVAAVAGSYALSGTAASLEFGREAAAVAGSYTLSGTAATLKFGREVAAVAGSYTLTGAAAGLTKLSPGVYSIPALPGSYALTGATATLRQTRKVAAVSGSYALSGAVASLERGKVVSAVAGAYTLTGTAATLVKAGFANLVLPANPGTYTLTGSDVTLRYSGAQVDIGGGGGGGGGRRRRKQWVRGAPYPWEKDEDEEEEDKKKKVKKRVTVKLVDEALDEMADVEGIPDWWADLNPRVVKTQISDYVLVAAGADHQEVVEAVMTEIADELDEEEAMVLLLS